MRLAPKNRAFHVVPGEGLGTGSARSVRSRKAHAGQNLYAPATGAPHRGQRCEGLAATDAPGAGPPTTAPPSGPAVGPEIGPVACRGGLPTEV